MRIDAHTHVFPPGVIADRARYAARDRGFGAVFADPRARMATADDLVAALDEAGFDRAVIVGWGWRDPALCRFHNDYLVDSVHRFPTRLVGFASVQPRAPRQAVREAERAIAAGLRGIGELMPHLQGYRLDDERLLWGIAREAVQRGVPLLTHVSEPVGHAYSGKGDVAPAAALRLAAAHPDLTLICAHWGGGLPFYELMPEVASAARNVWYDTAASPFLYDARIFAAARALRVLDRVLFASDFPLMTIARAIRQIDEAGLSEAERGAILGGNATRLLNFANAAGEKTT